jgi:hypothetical protein
MAPDRRERQQGENRDQEAATHARIINRRYWQQYEADHLRAVASREALTVHDVEQFASERAR